MLGFVRVARQLYWGNNQSVNAYNSEHWFFNRQYIMCVSCDRIRNDDFCLCAGSTHQEQTGGGYGNIQVSGMFNIAYVHSDDSLVCL